MLTLDDENFPEVCVDQTIDTVDLLSVLQEKVAAKEIAHYYRWPEAALTMAGDSL